MTSSAGSLVATVLTFRQLTQPLMTLVVVRGKLTAYNPHVLDMGCGAPSGALAFLGTPE